MEFRQWQEELRILQQKLGLKKLFARWVPLVCVRCHYFRQLDSECYSCYPYLFCMFTLDLTLLRGWGPCFRSLFPSSAASAGPALGEHPDDGTVQSLTVNVDPAMIPVLRNAISIAAGETNNSCMNGDGRMCVYMCYLLFMYLRYSDGNIYWVPTMFQVLF